MSSIKEPLFFAVEGESEPFRGPKDNQGIRDIKTYCSLFSGVRDEKAIGEASPLYLYSPKAPYRIKHYIPDVKIIAILRNPIDRAYSHFLHHRLLEYENLDDFREAINAEEERMRNGWSPFWFYRRMGLYAEQIARYLSLFCHEQIGVFLFEDLQRNPRELIKSIVQFLDLDGKLVIKAPARHNVSGYPINVKLNTFLTQPNFISDILRPFLSEKTRLKLRLKVWDVILGGLRQSNLRKPELQTEVREWLIEYYREDILQTQDILRRDLSHWLEIPVSANKDNHN
ncbi:MAG: sulfotransferase [Candidatus Dadabacteria bacterium]